MIEADALPENQDWTKRTWDLPADWTPEEIAVFLLDTGWPLDEYAKLPVAQYPDAPTPRLDEDTE